MLLGLTLIGIGIVIALVPQLLVVAISVFFVTSGVMVLVARQQWKRMGRDATIVRAFWW